jgi:hypothetical protein
VTATAPAVGAPVPRRVRPMWRAVVVPDEHGGWGLTLEPALLGILVAPSLAGAALVVAAFLAFLVRTPLKLVLVDRWRGRRLPRTRLAAALVAAEAALLALLGGLALGAAGPAWLVPVAVATPLVGLELWFDMRSRGRRLVPELAGAFGIGATAAAIALAGGEGAALAAALWVVLAGRALAAIPFVRVQIARLRHGEGPVRTSDLATAVGIAVALVAVLVDHRLAAGAAAVSALALLQVLWVRRPPVPAKVLGLRQLLLGLAVVGVTAVGVVAA